MKDNTYLNYVRRLEEIRRLSTPSLEGIPDADGYSDRIRDNFISIGKLAEENRAFLDASLYPVVYAKGALSQDQAEGLSDLAHYLLSAENVENLDLPIMSLISQRLLEASEGQENEEERLARLDMRLDTCYALMTVMGRSDAYSNIADMFRREGLRIGAAIARYLEHDSFRALSEQSRHLVLTDVRYTAVFYEGIIEDEDSHVREPEYLESMLKLADDPFYRELTPNFDWRYFRYRALNYYAKVTDLGNRVGYDRATLETIWRRTEEYVELWQSDEAFFSRCDNEKQVRLLLCRNRYLAGKIDLEEYRATLRDLYLHRDPTLYDLNGIYENLQLPAEAICTMDAERVGNESRLILRDIYRNMILYAFHMPNSGSLSSMLEYYIDIINRFIEVPGEISFENMVLRCLAALHPPTYIHSMMVARISRCLCGFLIDSNPRLLVGVLGCESEEEVRRRRDELCDFTFHAGLCHDFGKLAIIDTIFVYGRNLLDIEFGLIRTHPRIGSRMLSRYDSTRAYADVALGHHRWYDNTKGYPEDFDTSRSPLKPIIDLVLCADCLDAATDSVGRSYRKGKTFEDFVGEVRAEDGTHYAPWLMPILTDKKAADVIRQLLREGRRETYRGTYHLLYDMQNREV